MARVFNEIGDCYLVMWRLCGGNLLWSWSGSLKKVVEFVVMMGCMFLRLCDGNVLVEDD